MSTASDITTLRAQWAWQKVAMTDPEIKYREFIKGVPALINSSGLIAAMAYINSRTGSNKNAAEATFLHLLEWLVQSGAVDAKNARDTNGFFEVLVSADTVKQRQMVEETIAILAWLRRFSDVTSGEKNGTRAGE